jgi:hypothetical protein
MKRFTPLILCFALGCQKGEAPSTERAAVRPAETAPTEPTPTAPRLTRNPDGTLRLEFVDRWGAKFDATYESFTYLERALPTVSRGLNDAQLPQLKHAVDEQRPR